MRLGTRRESPTDVQPAVSQDERLDAVLSVVAQLVGQTPRALRQRPQRLVVARWGSTATLGKGKEE